MSIVNVRVKNIRPEYNNFKEWCEGDDNVYVDRGRIVFIDKQRYSKQDSIWHSPYTIGTHGTRDEVLLKYKDYITNKLINDNNMKNELQKLKGKI
jgi:hypothetical protein